MHCPGFTIIRCGYYDTTVPYPDSKPIKDRMAAYYEIEFFADDQPGQACVNGVWYPLLRDSYVCTKPGQLRRSRLPFCCYHIHLKTEDEQLRRLLDSLPTSSLLWSAQEITNLFRELVDIGTNEELLLGSCVLKILHLIHKYHMPVPERTGNRVMLHEKALLEVETYIREHLNEDLSLERLAARCNMNPSYFHRVFKAAFRRTPAEFVLMWRIMTAKRELLKGDLSLSDVAARCGFSSQFAISSRSTPA